MLADITRRELLEAGRSLRREVLGEEFVSRAYADADEFTRPLQDMVTEYCWGAVWSRPELGRRERSMINLSMITALNRPQELATHVRAALTNGVTPVEIREILLQVGVYAGQPAAIDAFRVAAPIVREHTAE